MNTETSHLIEKLDLSWIMTILEYGNISTKQGAKKIRFIILTSYMDYKTLLWCTPYIQPDMPESVPGN